MIGLTSSLALFVVLGIFAQWLAWRFRFPAIVLLTIVGVIVGPILNWVDPNAVFGNNFSPIIELAVSIVLFEGALNLRFFEFREAGRGVSRLVLLGIPVNLALASLLARYLLDFSWPLSVMTGSILVITGPTVIIPALKQAKLIRRPASYLKWEGILTDPIGALFAILTFEYILFAGEGSALTTTLAGLFRALSSSFVLAFSAGSLLNYLFRKNLSPDFLKVPLILSSLLGLVVLSNHIQEGSGFLLATFYGLYFGNVRLSVLTDLRRFKESLSVFIVSFLFIVISSSLDLNLFLELDWRHIVYIVFVLFVIRPIAIFASNWRSEMSFKEKIIVSAFAPRGIVVASLAGTLGPILYSQGMDEARYVLPLVFAIIFVTVTLHGLSLSYLAKWLGLSARQRQGIAIVGASTWTINLAKKLKELGINVLLSDTSRGRLNRARRAQIEVHEGPILVDIEDGIPDLSEYKYLFVGTENDAYNALVSKQIGAEIGSKNAFQLPFQHESEGNSDVVPAELQGRVIKSKRFYFESLMEKHFKGWRFHSEQLTKEGLMNIPVEKLSETDPLPVLILHKDKNLSFFYTDNMRAPEEGDLLVTYGPRKASS